MHVFYTPDIQSHAELPEEEAAHAVRVLRLQTGDEVTPVSYTHLTLPTT